MKGLLSGAALAALLMAAQPAAQAAEDAAAHGLFPQLDHLACYTPLNPTPPDPATIDVRIFNQFQYASCRIQLPPLLFCSETQKANPVTGDVDDPRGDQAGDFLCYRVLGCDFQEVGGRQVRAEDQFNLWGFTINPNKPPRILCAPAEKLFHDFPLPVPAL